MGRFWSEYNSPCKNISHVHISISLHVQVRIFLMSRKGTMQHPTNSEDAYCNHQRMKKFNKVMNVSDKLFGQKHFKRT